MGGTVIILEVMVADEIMLYLLLLGRRRGGSTDGYFFKNLSGVGIDDGCAQVLCQREA